MHFHNLTDSELLTQTRAAATREKTATLELLEHLLEVERRGLAFREGYSSVWEYVHRGLGYSEAGASERVAAMRLLKRAPEAVEMLRREELSLTVAAKVQHFVRAAEKLEERVNVVGLLEEVAGKSKRDVEKILVAKNPQAALPRERMREVAPGATELRLVVDAELAALLEEAKVLLGTASHSDTLKRVLAKAVAEKRALAPTQPAALATRPKQPAETRSRYIPRDLLRRVWARSGGRCEYEGPAGRCTSQHRPQVDHRVPLARGGKTEDSNLRLLCANHNLAEARELGLGVGYKDQEACIYAIGQRHDL